MTTHYKEHLLQQSLAVRTTVLPEVRKVIETVKPDFDSVKKYQTSIIDWLKPLVNLTDFYVYPMNGITQGLDWWYAKDCFLPKETYVMKYGVEPKSIESMFENYGIHLWRNLVTNKYKLDVERDYDERSLWEKIKKFVDEA